jgi:hypothetical protein
MPDAADTGSGRKSASPKPMSTDPQALVAQLRADGWTVAVHNDYRHAGQSFTFWLWTHPNGRWIKGEGSTDAEALSQCVAALSPPADAEALARLDPGESDYEAGRARLLAELRRIAADDPRNGYGQIADDVAEGRAVRIDSWIAMQLLGASHAQEAALREGLGERPEINDADREAARLFDRYLRGANSLGNLRYAFAKHRHAAEARATALERQLEQFVGRGAWLEAQIAEILDGIEDTQTTDGGWWETSTGEAFGTERLRLVRDAIRAAFRIGENPPGLDLAARLREGVERGISGDYKPAIGLMREAATFIDGRPS